MMSKMKLRWITIVSLAVLFVFTFGLAVGMLPVSRIGAGALTYQPEDIFPHDADVKVDASPATDEEGKAIDSYVLFNFTGNASVYYRRDLALKWFEAYDAEKHGDIETVETVGKSNPGVVRYFSMTLSIPSIEFETFEISFESAEENITKDGHATNVLVFDGYDEENKTLSVAVHNAYYEEGDDVASMPVAYTLGDDLTISFAELPKNDPERAGKFDVKVNGETVGTFENIGGYFMEYLSSGTTQTPMTFSVTFGEDADKNGQSILMKDLNGQSFLLDKDGKVEDNADPVLVLNESIYSFRLGQRFSLTYEVIDVCDKSITPARSFYMLKKDADGNWYKPNESKDSSDYKSLTTNGTFFTPTSDTEEEAYVSIRFVLTDDSKNESFVYLTWYAADEDFIVDQGNKDTDDNYLPKVKEYTCPECGTVIDEETYNAAADDAVCTGEVTNTDDEGNETTTPCTVVIKAETNGYKESVTEWDVFDYILVDREAKGPSYIRLAANDTSKDNKPADEDVEAFNEAVADYQNKVDEAAAKISAGDGAYIYFPSLRNLIASNYADYRNLRFSIYYYKSGTVSGSTASSATSLRYNNLRIEVDETGYYRFRVIAQDAAGNAMKYYDEDGELVTVTSSNVWDIDGIPEFSFFVDYDGPSIEDTESQVEGRREKKYTITGFDVIALSGYETSYTLYRLNDSALDQLYTYEQLVKLANEDHAKIDEWVKADTLIEINKYNPEITEDDPEWENTPDNKYHWDPDSSLSFIPQLTGYYFVKVDVTDAYLVDVTTSAYQVIQIRDPMDQIPGQSRWFQDNIAAIVLFSISAVLLVAIVVILVVKPSDQTVEEVDLSTLKGGKKGKDLENQDNQD